MRRNPIFLTGIKTQGVERAARHSKSFTGLAMSFLAEHLQSKLFTGGSSGVNSPQVDLELSRDSHDHFFLLPGRYFTPCSLHFTPPLPKPFILRLIANDSPCRLNEQPPEPGVSVFVNAALKATSAAGILLRAETCVTGNLAAV